jgi:hypothetical protein
MMAIKTRHPLYYLFGWPTHGSADPDESGFPLGGAREERNTSYDKIIRT